MNPPKARLPACMGGFCRRRESCRRYHYGDRRRAAERLCSSGGIELWQPIRIEKPKELVP